GGVGGAVIIAIDGWLKSRHPTFRVPVLAAAIGIYLPLELMVPIFLVGLLAYLVDRPHGAVGSHDESLRYSIHLPGTLFAPGLLPGEALMGIFIAIPIVASGSADVLALPEGWQFGKWIGLAVLAVVAWLLYRSGTKKAMGDVEPGPL